MDLIPDQGTEIPHAMGHGHKIKTNKERRKGFQLPAPLHIASFSFFEFYNVLFIHHGFNFLQGIFLTPAGNGFFSQLILFFSEVA